MSLPIKPQPTNSQIVSWTALPQGFVPGNTSTVRVAVFAMPQLYHSSVVSHAATLAMFPDWINWPQTVLDAAADFQVLVDGNLVTSVTQPDLSVLRPDCWTAMFTPAATRIDSFVADDFSKVVPTTFRAAQVHEFIQSKIYSPVSGTAGQPGESTVTTTVHPNGTVVVDAATTGGAAVAALQNPSTPEFAKALAFHATPRIPLIDGTTPVPQPPPPVFDFHEALSALGNYPELLPALGLVFRLEFDLPPGTPRDGTNFTVTVVPGWTPDGPVGAFVPVPITAQIESLTDGLPADFFAAAHGADYVGGHLNIGNGVTVAGASTAPITVVDYDIDGACESLNAYVRNITSTAEAQVQAEITTALFDLTLPGLRSIGPTLVWDDWGGPANDSTTSFNLISLATRQAAIQAAILAAAVPGGPDVPALFMEDITRGWRLDVDDNDQPKAIAQSLHWRSGSFAFGADQGVTLVPPQPVEGFFVPGVTTAPAVDDSGEPAFLVHESIARWDGWSLSAPTPFNQINDDGTIADTFTNPSSNQTDGSHVNAQLSAAFTAPVAGQRIDDGDQIVGFTGLPLLRFGRNYAYAVRAVDLSGWSTPQVPTAAERYAPYTQPIPHLRWEPVPAPLVLPTQSLGAGEGVLTIVLRDEGEAAAAPSSRWLFPPKVRQRLAEENGAFDDANGLPDPTLNSLISRYADGTVHDLPGIAADTGATANNGNPVLPLAADGSAPSIAVPWLVDVASFGLGLSGTGGSYPLSSVFPVDQVPYDVGHNPSTFATPVFLDPWSPAAGGAWPEMLGKLLRVVPLPAVLPGSPDYVGPITAVPTWTVTPADATHAEVLTLGVVPGSVYELDLSSIPRYQDEATFGSSVSVVPWGSPGSTDGVVPALDQLFLTGQSSATPALTLRVVHATLLPAFAPAFSNSLLLFRDPFGTDVRFFDEHYTADLATTSTITYTATWTDHVDTGSNPDPDTATSSITQASLVLIVDTGPSFPYPPAAVPDPILASATPPTGVPFGTVDPIKFTAGTALQLTATQRIGDTKHHTVTYTPTAASRFAAFFATTSTVTLDATTWTTLTDGPIDPNRVRVIHPAEPHTSAVTVPNHLFDVDPERGRIRLAHAKASVTHPVTLPVSGHSSPNVRTVALAGVALKVTWTPDATITGPPVTYDIMSTCAPPPLKITKVAPAWTSSTVATPADRTTYTRTGNILRVYLERPWYVTGNDEQVAVIFDPNSSGVPTLTPNNAGFADFSLLGYDPITVSGQGKSGSPTQTGLDFVADAGPVMVSTELRGNLSAWTYTPEFDPVSDRWFVDVQLKLDPPPPPGYFVRLALARYQPHTNYSWDSSTGIEISALSPVSRVTFAQPVPDRTVVVVHGRTSITVTVTGPGYYGWRAAPAGTTYSTAPNTPPIKVSDAANADAAHPNSPAASAGANETSTMVLEVQYQDEAIGLSGDFAWRTAPTHTYRLTPTFPTDPAGGGSADLEWAISGLTLPTGLGPLRLRISELDYYPFAQSGLPASIDTSQRRPFVAHIDLSE